MEIAILSILLLVMFIFRRSISAWSQVAESKSLDVATRQEVEGYRYNAKTKQKIDELDEVYDSASIKKIMDAKRKASLAKALA